MSGTRVPASSCRGFAIRTAGIAVDFPGDAGAPERLVAPEHQPEDPSSLSERGRFDSPDAGAT